MIGEQAENILNYLKTKLAPVAPLAEGDVVGFMRDSELRNVFRSLDGAAKEKLMVSMYAGNQTDLCDALLRGNAICSGVTDSQLERLTFARIATDNGAVIKSVSNPVKPLTATCSKSSLFAHGMQIWYLEAMTTLAMWLLESPGWRICPSTLMVWKN